MSNLFVIGNGFDVAHSLPTRYINFKEYLCHNIWPDQPIDPNNLPVIRKMPALPNNEPVKIDFLNEEMRFIYWLIDDIAQTSGDLKWNTFETSLGILEYEKVYEKCHDEDCFNERFSRTLETLEHLLFEWISSIEISGKTKSNRLFSYIVNPGTDLAVNFNYTETLETVYGMDHENICYIHGQRETDAEKRFKNGLTSYGMNKTHLIVGYNMKILGEKCEEEDNRSDKEKLLIGLKSILIKGTEECVNANKNFFDKIRNTDIDRIYSYGFSFSEVDRPQIAAICQALNGDGSRAEKLTWYLNDFDSPENIARFKEILLAEGFRGRFGLYNTECRDNQFVDIATNTVSFTLNFNMHG